jgi:hypothetical protein
MLTLSKVGAPDLPELMPMLRGYCDFYEVNPSEGALLAMCQALIDEPAQGEQWIARDQAGTPAGFDPL